MRNKYLTEQHSVDFSSILQGGVSFLATNDSSALQRALTAMAYKKGIKLKMKTYYASDGVEGLKLIRVERAEVV